MARGNPLKKIKRSERRKRLQFIIQAPNSTNENMEMSVLHAVVQNGVDVCLETIH